MLSVYLSVHRLQVLCNILPWDFNTHTGLILFICYMDAYIEFLKALVSRGDCGSERVNHASAPQDEGEVFVRPQLLLLTIRDLAFHARYYVEFEIRFLAVLLGVVVIRAFLSCVCCS